MAGVNLDNLSFSGTKDIKAEALFKSVLLRWVWRFYTQRLTQAGRWFLWPTLAFASYGSSSLQLQAYVPFSYAFGLWAVALLAMLLMKPRVLLCAQHAGRVCAGETLPVEVTVTQNRALGGAPLKVIPHRLPESVDAAEESGVALPPLHSGEKARIWLGLRCERRGVHRLQGFRVETDFPFGLLRAYCAHEDEQPLVVYPRFTPLARLHVPTGRRFQPGGVALASSVGESFEYAGNREYREGDSVRNIDWRATARLSRPIVREYREEYFHRVAVILDTHVPFLPPPSLFDPKRDWGEFREDMSRIWHRPRDTMGIVAAGVTRDFGKIGRWMRHKSEIPAERQDAFERAVSVCAAVSDYMSRQEYLVDIFAAGPRLYHLTAGRSLAYLDQILDILACVEPNPEEPFAAIEPELMEQLESITSVICVFLDWNPARQEFVNKLRVRGAGLKVVVVRDGACTLDPAADGIPVISKAMFEAGIEEL